MRCCCAVFSRRCHAPSVKTTAWLLPGAPGGVPLTAVGDVSRVWLNFSTTPHTLPLHVCRNKAAPWCCLMLVDTHSAQCVSACVRVCVPPCGV